MNRTAEDIRYEIAQELDDTVREIRNRVKSLLAAQERIDRLMGRVPQEHTGAIRKLEDRVIRLTDDLERVGDRVAEEWDRALGLDLDPPEPVALISLEEGDRFTLHGGHQGTIWTVVTGYHADHDPTGYEAECVIGNGPPRSFGGTTLVHPA